MTELEKTKLTDHQLTSILHRLERSEDEALAATAFTIGSKGWDAAVQYCINIALDAQRVIWLGEAGAGRALIEVAKAAFDRAASNLWYALEPEDRAGLKTSVTRFLDAVVELAYNDGLISEDGIEA